MPLQLRYADPHSGAIYPNAYWHADDVRVGLRDAFVEITLGIYVDAAAFRAGNKPLGTVLERLTDVENASVRGQFLGVIDLLLAARDDFAGAAIVS